MILGSQGATKATASLPSTCAACGESGFIVPRPFVWVTGRTVLVIPSVTTVVGGGMSDGSLESKSPEPINGTKGGSLSGGGSGAGVSCGTSGVSVGGSSSSCGGVLITKSPGKGSDCGGSDCEGLGINIPVCGVPSSGSEESVGKELGPSSVGPFRGEDEGDGSDGSGGELDRDISVSTGVSGGGLDSVSMRGSEKVELGGIVLETF